MAAFFKLAAVLVQLCVVNAVDRPSRAPARVAVKDIVNNVAWWPPSNLQFEEAVGVVSRGVMFATGTGGMHTRHAESARPLH